MSECTATEAAAPIKRAETAVRSLASHIRFWAAAGITLWLDLWSKHRVFQDLAAEETYTVVPRVLEFRRSLNDGAVFGSLVGHVELFITASLLALAFVLYLFCGSTRRQRALHVALGLVLAGTLGNLYDRAFQVADIVTYESRSGRTISVIGRIVNSAEEKDVHIGQWPEGTNVQTFPRSEVTMRRQGVVRDFIKFVPRFPTWVPRVGRYDMWPWIFNVADTALVCGVGLLLLRSWRDRHPTPEGDPTAA